MIITYQLYFMIFTDTSEIMLEPKESGDVAGGQIAIGEPALNGQAIVSPHPRRVVIIHQWPVYQLVRFGAAAAVLYAGATVGLRHCSVIG